MMGPTVVMWHSVKVRVFELTRESVWLLKLKLHLKLGFRPLYMQEIHRVEYWRGFGGGPPLLTKLQFAEGRCIDLLRVPQQNKTKQNLVELIPLFCIQSTVKHTLQGKKELHMEIIKQYKRNSSFIVINFLTTAL